MTTRSVEMPNDKPPPSADPPPPQAAIDDTATLYSILVPGGTESYVRLGTPDANPEGRLPPDPAKPDQPGHDTSSPYDPGILLYTTGTIEQTARALVTHTTEKLELRGSDAGLSAANWSTDTGTGFLAQASFQRGDFGAVTVGAIENSIVGSQTELVLGQSALMSTGLRLNANYGSTLNLYGGQVINLIAGAAEIKGWASYYSSDPNHSMVAGRGVTLIASRAFTADDKLTTTYQRVMAVAAAAAAAEAAAISALPWAGSDSERRRDVTLELMTATIAISGGIATALAVIQAAGLLLGLRLRKAHQLALASGAGSVISISDSTVVLRSELSSVYIYPDSIEFRCGNSVLTVDDSGITAQYAATPALSMKIDRNGVQMTGPHNFRGLT